MPMIRCNGDLLENCLAKRYCTSEAMLKTLNATGKEKLDGLAPAGKTTMVVVVMVKWITRSSKDAY